MTISLNSLTNKLSAANYVFVNTVTQSYLLSSLKKMQKKTPRWGGVIITLLSQGSKPYLKLIVALCPVMNESSGWQTCVSI